MLLYDLTCFVNTCVFFLMLLHWMNRLQYLCECARHWVLSQYQEHKWVETFVSYVYYSLEAIIAYQFIARNEGWNKIINCVALIRESAPCVLMEGFIGLVGLLQLGLWEPSPPVFCALNVFWRAAMSAGSSSLWRGMVSRNAFFRRKRGRLEITSEDSNVISHVLNRKKHCRREFYSMAWCSKCDFQSHEICIGHPETAKILRHNEGRFVVLIQQPRKANQKIKCENLHWK